MEWSERAEGLLPDDCIRVAITARDENIRRVEITGREMEEADASTGI